MLLVIFLCVESFYRDTFCIISVIEYINNVTTRMDITKGFFLSFLLWYYSIKCLRCFWFTFVWQKGKKSVLGEEENFQDQNHVIKIMSDQKRWSRNAFILPAVIPNWAARQEWLGRHKAISDFSKTRKIGQGHTVAICVCFKEIHNKIPWFWWLFADNAYEKQMFWIYGPISVLAAQERASGDDGKDPGGFWQCVHQGRALARPHLVSFLLRWPWTSLAPAAGGRAHVTWKAVVGASQVFSCSISIGICYARCAGDHEFCYFFPALLWWYFLL